MSRISRIGLAGFALGFAALTTAPAARAEGASEGAGLQAVAERMRQDAMLTGTGWQNGTATLNQSGAGYGISYSGTPRGDAGRGPLMIVGNMEGNPVVEPADTAPRTGRLQAQRR